MHFFLFLFELIGITFTALFTPVILPLNRKYTQLFFNKYLNLINKFLNPARKTKQLLWKSKKCNLGVEGLEPSRPISQQILSLLCLPFHHTPKFKATPRFELGIEDLQSTALPLGHIALLVITTKFLILHFNCNV